MSITIPGVNRLKHDSQLVWKPAHIFIPAMNFTGMSVGAINEGGTGNFVYGQKWEGSHTGTPTTREISTFGVNGVLMTAAGNEVNHYMVLPGNMDLSKRIYARVHWAVNETVDTRTATWKVWYKPIIPNVTTLSAIGDTGGTALDRVIPAQASASTAYVWLATEYGYIDAGKLSDRTENIIWSVELDAFHGSMTGDKFLLGLEIMYTPKNLSGSPMLHEAKRPVFMLGKSYA